MSTIRKQAQKRAKDWKLRLKLKNYELAKMLKISDSEASRLLTGKAYLSDKVCQRVMAAKEPRQ